MTVEKVGKIGLKITRRSVRKIGAVFTAAFNRMTAGVFLNLAALYVLIYGLINEPVIVYGFAQGITNIIIEGGGLAVVTDSFGSLSVPLWPALSAMLLYFARRLRE